MEGRGGHAAGSGARGGAPGSGGSLRCFVTDDSPRFGQLASRFLGQQMVAKPVVVSPDDLHALGRTRDLRMSA